MSAALLEFLAAYRALQYLDVACCTLMVSDYLHTLPGEVRLVWSAPWSVPKVLFLAVRYYGIINVALTIRYDFPAHNTPSACKQLFLEAAAILFVRLYGFSGRSKRVLILSILTYIGVTAASCTFFAKFYHTLLYSDFPIPHVCVHAAGNHKYFGAVFTLLLFNVTSAMLGMLFIMYRKYKAYRSSLVKAFYRDGIGYFVCLSALALTNLVMNFAPTVEAGHKFILSPLEASLHVVLSTRMLLHLRSTANREPIGSNNDSWGVSYNSAGREISMGGGRSEISTMQFA